MPTGAIGGVITGLGQYAQEQNHMQNVAQVAANEEMASAFDKLAEVTNDPAERFRLQQLAYQARSKGAKAIPKAQQDYWQQTLQQASDTQRAQQAAQQAQQGQQIQQAQGTVAQGVTGQPPALPPGVPAGAVPIRAAAPTNGPGAIGQAGPAGITPLVPPRPLMGGAGGGGLPAPIPPNPTSGAPSPQGAPAPSGPPEMQQEAASPSPNGVGGVGAPSPGFGAAPPAIPAPVPVPKTRWWQAPVSTTGAAGAPLHIRNQEQQQDFLARGAGAVTQAQEEAKFKVYEKKFKEVTGYVDRLNQNPASDVEWTVEMGANGLPIAKMDRGVGTGIVSGADVGDLPVIGGGVKRADATYTLVRYGNGKEKLAPVSPIQRTDFTAGPNGEPTAVQYNPRVAGSAGAAGIQPRATFNPRLFNLQGGGVGVGSAAQVQAGATPAVVPGAIGTGAPTTSTLNVPGQLPQTTTRVRGAVTPVTPPAGLPAPRSANAPAPSTNPTAPTAALAAATDNSPIAVNYRNWIAGKATLSDKEQTAARQYAASRGLTTPNVLDAGAQKSIATINPILEEIVHARQLLKNSGMLDQSELDSKLAMTKAYLKYKAGFTDPLTKAISDLSFDRIRSVGQALQGTGSRAYPIFQMGLEHTPQIGLNSDSAKMMDNKLEGMERRARESIASAMTENKSGVAPQLQAPGVTPPAAGAVLMKAPTGETMPVPANQVDHYKALGAMVVQ